MRARALALAFALTALLGCTATAVPGAAADSPALQPARGDHAEPEEVLEQAARLLTGASPATPPAGHGGHRSHHAELSLAMRDLFMARPHLGLIEGVRADVLLARPDNPLYDTTGEGYRGRSERACGKRICIHWSERGEDAPRSRTWVRRTLRTLAEVWNFEIATLGLDRPPSDGRAGGDRRFDVYLAELGDRGLFGYCTPEKQVRGEEFAASGYCVLDNDFARKQYHADPRASLRVTAAHEFFHAIQFGYDFREDPWLLESTATWMEEQFADAADDNRRYLRYGSVRRPEVPLDQFSNTDYAQYGTWAFWEFLSAEYGDRIIREVWARADARRGAPDDYSLQALAAVLRDRGGLTDALASYAAANLDPERHYEEGAHWPRARLERRIRIDVGETKRARLSVDHLAAAHVRVRAGDDVPARGAVLALEVDGPRRTSARAVVVTVRLAGGKVTRRTIDLDRSGAGSARVALGRRVEEVLVTAVNASRRYECDQHTMLACSGKPLDQDKRFTIVARIGRG